MTSSVLFWIIIGVIVVDFILDQILDAMNARHFGDPIPAPLSDVYDTTEYQRSQRYKKAKHRFGVITSSFTLILTLVFFFADGFEVVDNFARQYSDNRIIVALIFFGIIIFASDILSTPFAYYNTFVIEERFGFNKTTVRTFFLDKIRGWSLMGVLGGGLLSLIIWFFELSGPQFWIYAWVAVTLFSKTMTFFYSRWIVPLFNKQTPLPDGMLRDAIGSFAQKVDFALDNIYVIDGSKRSTKANAYFSGFGKQKRITLYDTLIEELDTEEVVAVLAHEVGHYRKRHVVFNLLMTVLLTGSTFFLLSLFINIPEFSLAIGVQTPSFHAGLIAFAILYSPISAITGLLMNYISRKFEYEADSYAKTTYAASPLATSLKKLSKSSLSNLTPHPTYVFVHYSHPTLLQRIEYLLA